MLIIVILGASYMVGALAAIGAGIAHALLVQRVSPAALIVGVNIVAVAFHIGAVFLISDKPQQIFESPLSFLEVAFVPIISASAISSFLVWRTA
jgi:cytochrome bd-type quinol oxidase subunit 2